MNQDTHHGRRQHTAPIFISGKLVSRYVKALGYRISSNPTIIHRQYMTSTRMMKAGTVALGFVLALTGPGNARHQPCCTVLWVPIRHIDPDRQGARDGSEQDSHP